MRIGSIWSGENYRSKYAMNFTVNANSFMDRALLLGGILVAAVHSYLYHDDYMDEVLLTSVEDGRIQHSGFMIELILMIFSIVAFMAAIGRTFPQFQSLHILWNPSSRARNRIPTRYSIQHCEVR